MNKPPPGLLEFKEMSRKFPWNIIILLGSGFALADACKVKKIGTQCVHVSAIWKLNNHMGNKAMHASQTKDICVLSLQLLGFTVDVGKPGM